jgi:hypothetical protein
MADTEDHAEETFEMLYIGSLTGNRARSGIPSLDSMRLDLRQQRMTHGEESEEFHEALVKTSLLVMEGLQWDVNNREHRNILACSVLTEAAFAAGERRMPIDGAPSWVWEGNADGELDDVAETFYRRVARGAVTGEGDGNKWWCSVDGVFEVHETENAAFYAGQEERVCNVCGASKPEDRNKTNMLRCSRCRAVYYCGADCQRADWKAAHKKECVAVADIKK